MAIIVFLPELTINLFPQPCEIFIFHDTEYLVSGRSKTQAVSLLAKSLPDSVCSPDCRFPDFHIQIVPEQFVKLNPQKPSLCQQGAMLLNNREQMRNPVRIRNHHGLSEQSAALGAAA